MAPSEAWILSDVLPQAQQGLLPKNKSCFLTAPLLRFYRFPSVVAQAFLGIVQNVRDLYLFTHAPACIPEVQAKGERNNQEITWEDERVAGPQKPGHKVTRSCKWTRENEERAKRDRIEGHGDIV
jgi:hypothetical protein